MYNEGVRNLLVFETSVDSERLDGLQDQMLKLQKENEEMKAQILELRLEKLEKANGIKKK